MYEKCSGMEHARLHTQVILQSSGEGIVLRKFRSLYTGGISDSLCKFKALRDREGLVVDCDPDGKTFTLQLPDNITFKAITQEGKLQRLPVKGEIVSFSYHKYYQNGQPANAKIDKIRSDLSWMDVLKNFHQQVLRSRRVESVKALSRNPQGHWTTEEGKNTKEFFEQFANEKGLDPRDPNTWYNVKGADIIARGSRVLAGYGFSFPRAVMDIYPDIGLEIQKFHYTTKNYWNSKENRRKYFDEYAKKKGFDPLITDNWYNISRSELKRTEKAAHLMEAHKGSVLRTLLDVYPDIGLNESLFSKKSNKYWESMGNRRAVLENYAKIHKFDPLNAANWYSLSIENLATIRGGWSLLRKYKNSIVNLLFDIYPNIGLVRSNFSSQTVHPWSKEIKRKIADEFADKMNFDPLVRSNWQKINKSIIMQDKRLGALVQYRYCGSVMKTIDDIYL